MHEKQSKAQVYQIKIKGRLNQRWAERFDGMALAYVVEDDGTFVTTLTGTVVDQAALHGLFMRIRDLNLRLVSVVGVKTKEKERSDG
jgi:hypothetical protein